MDREERLVSHEREKYLPIAEAIGLIAIKWNGIHNGLGQIFSLVSQLSEDDAFEKWNNKRFDGKKRKLLDKTIQEFYGKNEESREKYDIINLLDRIRKLTSNRDSSVHCPFTLFIEDNTLKVLPDDTAENPHALNLRDIDFLSELQNRYDELHELEVLTYYLLGCIRDRNGYTPFPSELDL